MSLINHFDARRITQLNISIDQMTIYNFRRKIKFWWLIKKDIQYKWSHFMWIRLRNRIIMRNNSRKKEVKRFWILPNGSCAIVWVEIKFGAKRPSFILKMGVPQRTQQRFIAPFAGMIAVYHRNYRPNDPQASRSSALINTVRLSLERKLFVAINRRCPCIIIFSNALKNMIDNLYHFTTCLEI